MNNEYVTKKMGGAKLLIKKKPEKKKIRKGKNKQTGVNVDKKSYDFKKAIKYGKECLIFTDLGAVHLLCKTTLGGGGGIFLYFLLFNSNWLCAYFYFVPKVSSNYWVNRL